MNIHTNVPPKKSSFVINKENNVDKRKETSKVEVIKKPEVKVLPIIEEKEEVLIEEENIFSEEEDVFEEEK